MIIIIILRIWFVVQTEFLEALLKYLTYVEHFFIYEEICNIVA